MFKNKKEFAQAMLDGRKFKIAGKVCCFDDKKGNSPFRWGDETILGIWNYFHEAKEVKEWYDNIPKQGLLCWVWGGTYTKGEELAIVKEFRGHSNSIPFKTINSGSWSFAEPFSAKDIKEYTI